MKEKIFKIIRSLFVVCIFVLLTILTKNIFKGLISLVIGVIIDYFFKDNLNSLLESVHDLINYPSWKSSQSKLKKLGKLNEDTIIRISFAYLFRIKVDGKYF